MSKRIVNVYLVDPHESVPLDKSVLFSLENKVTDLTDQELYFEIPVQELLKSHNAYRVTVVDRQLTQKMGKEAFLEPVKIRELKMMAVTIASF